MNFLQDPVTYVVIVLLLLPVARILYVLYSQKHQEALAKADRSSARRHKTRLK